jgi:5'-3' exonuclease
MGIDNFFNTINNHKIFENNISSSSTNEVIKNITQGENIYFDFNSIIYNEIQKIETELNYILYEIITGYDTDEKKKYLKKYLCLLDFDLNYLNYEEYQQLDKFKECFKSDNLMNILIKQIKNKIIEILTLYNISENIKYIFISIDGTPTMPKIIEQRKRRYINYVIEKIKRKIYEKYENTFDDNRKLFENNRIYIERTNITAYTSFTKFICEKIMNEEFKNKIFEILPNLKQYIVSEPSEFGEGEKKIIENIRLNNFGGNYVVISPDADMIILCLIQRNYFNKKKIDNKFQIIRENIKNNSIDVIDINKLYDSILNYILKRIEQSELNNFEINNERIIDDICVLLTLFGNDFIPKLRGLNMKNGFNIIFEVYVRHLTRTRNRYKYITFEEENVYKINYDNLNSFLYKIAENEHKLFLETYASMNYKNYGYINSCFSQNNGSPYFYDKLNIYVHGFNKLMSHLIANKKNDLVNGEGVYEQLLLKYSDSEMFITELLAFEANNFEFIDIEDKKYKCIELINKIINEIKTYGYYRNKLRFHLYSHTINDKYHQKILMENMDHPSMLITDYDYHIYKLENKLDEYYHIFNSEIDNQLGSIDILNHNGFYKLIIDNQIEKNKEIYYQEKLNIKNTGDMNKLCSAYISGMFWTFDHYFNKNNQNENRKYISTWSYDYISSPCIKDIINYMDQASNRNKLLNNIFFSVNNYKSIYYSPIHLFPNELEQYIFITPYEKLKNKVPEKYLEKLKKENFFMDLDEIVIDILDGKASNHIDCGKSFYLNKCSLLKMNKITCNEYMKMIINLRNLN